MNDDTISRQAAIDALKEAFNPSITNFVKAKMVIDNLPSEQPERPKGKWIPQDHNKSNGMASTLVFYYPKCSECGHSGNYTNFCPRCGADMTEETT